MWLARGENTLQIKQVQEGVSNEDGRLVNGLPLIIQDMLPIIMLNHVLHGWAGLVHVRCTNQWVIPAVIWVKDLRWIEVWMFKWLREGIQLTEGRMDRLLQHLQGTKRDLQS